MKISFKENYDHINKNTETSLQLYIISTSEFYLTKNY